MIEHISSKRQVDKLSKEMGIWCEKTGTSKLKKGIDHCPGQDRERTDKLSFFNKEEA